MKTIYKIITVLAVLILIIVFKEWLRTAIITSLGGFTERKVATKVVQEKKEGIYKIDSTAVFTKYVKARGIILNPEPKVIKVISYDTIRDTVYSEKVKEFNVKFKDSLIDGTMKIRNYFNGDLLSATFDYRHQFKERYYKRVDTILKTLTITETLYSSRGKIGVGIGVDSEFSNLDLLGGYTFKNGLQVLYEYSNPIKDFNVDVPQLNFQNLTFPREGKHKLKLLYNF